MKRILSGQRALGCKSDSPTGAVLWHRNIALRQGYKPLTEGLTMIALVFIVYDTSALKCSRWMKYARFETNYHPNITALRVEQLNDTLFCLWALYRRRFSARSQNCEKRLLTSSCSSVRVSAWNSSAPTGRIWMKYHIWAFFFRKSVEKIEFLLKYNGNNGYFTWRRFHIYDNISLSSF